MADKNEFPKMLYRDDKVQGAKPCFHPEGVFHAVAKNAEEEKAMLADGYRLTSSGGKSVKTELPAPASTAATPKAPRKPRTPKAPK